MSRLTELVKEATEWLDGMVSAPLYAIVISWVVAFVLGFIVGY